MKHLLSTSVVEVFYLKHYITF